MVDAVVAWGDAGAIASGSALSTMPGPTTCASRSWSTGRRGSRWPPTASWPRSCSIIEGMTAPALSPHFDDAVLSCAAWLEHHPGAVVATVRRAARTRVPADPAWDALAGFVDADHSAEARGAEDRRRSACWVPNIGSGFLDGGYKAEVGRPHQDPGGPGSFDVALTEVVGHLLEDALAPDRAVPSAWCTRTT